MYEQTKHWECYGGHTRIKTYECNFLPESFGNVGVVFLYKCF